MHLNQLQVINQEKNIFEYKNIINWFNNGTQSYKDWMEIVPEHGKHVKCTKNHKFLTPDGWKEAHLMKKMIKFLHQKNPILMN